MSDTVTDICETLRELDTLLRANQMPAITRVALDLRDAELLAARAHRGAEPRPQPRDGETLPVLLLDAPGAHTVVNDRVPDGHIWVTQFGLEHDIPVRTVTASPYPDPIPREDQESAHARCPHPGGEVPPDQVRPTPGDHRAG